MPIAFGAMCKSTAYTGVSTTCMAWENLKSMVQWMTGFLGGPVILPMILLLLLLSLLLSLSLWRNELYFDIYIRSQIFIIYVICWHCFHLMIPLWNSFTLQFTHLWLTNSITNGIEFDFKRMEELRTHGWWTLVYSLFILQILFCWLCFHYDTTLEFLYLTIYSPMTMIDQFNHV